MKVINNSSMPGACSERQVLLYPTHWDDPLPGTMEEIKISIVNDRSTASKRERDEVTAVTPCAKRSRHAVFSCSTPLSASARTHATQSKLPKEHPDCPAWHPLRPNPEQDNKWDDSLLEPSDNEDDSDLFLTLDEIETLLGKDDDDDDDDSCCAAEPLQNYYEMTTCVVTFTPSESGNEGENGGALPCKSLDISDNLTEESECEGDTSNYAAMPPSPCHSATDPVEVIDSNQSSICNVNSHEVLTAKTVMDSDLPTPLLGIKDVSASQLPNSCSPKHLWQQPLSVSRVDAAVDWSKDPDIDFDCDIENLLAISPGAAFSTEEDNGVESVSITAKGNNIVVSDSTLPPRDVESDQVLKAHTACSTSSDAAQYLSPLSLNTAGMPKVHHHHHHAAEPEPLKESLPSTSSSIAITAEPKLSQNVQSQKPPETKKMQNAESTSRPTHPTPSATPKANDNRSQVVASSDCSSNPERERPVIAVPALYRPSFRDILSDFELETNKAIYCDRVLMHIGQGESNEEDILHELASLLNRISRENPNWQHQSDVTKRNHPRFGTKPSKCCTLKQWVTKNGGSAERFKNFPETFQRSPIPSALPF